MRFALPLAVAAMMAAAPSHAQEDVLDYQGSMRCAAVYTFLAEVNEGEEDEDFVADMEEQAQRWLVMAMTRDGHEGTQALAEFEPLVEALVEKLEALAGVEIEGFLLDHVNRCEAFEAANFAEFNSIDMAD